MNTRKIVQITLSLVLVLFVTTMTSIVLAQPPGMPGAPDQAPIDGGLGILALSSGILAYKKLKSSKK
jgi:hypothetical protein